MVFAMERVIRRYGTRLVLCSGGEEQGFRGFLQHAQSSSWQTIETKYGPLGETSGGRFILLAPLQPGIQAGDTIRQGNRSFRVRRIEPIMVGDKTAYYWGLCVERGGDDQWGS